MLLKLIYTNNLTAAEELEFESENTTENKIIINSSNALINITSNQLLTTLLASADNIELELHAKINKNEFNCLLDIVSEHKNCLDMLYLDKYNYTMLNELEIKDSLTVKQLFLCHIGLNLNSIKILNNIFANSSNINQLKIRDKVNLGDLEEFLLLELSMRNKNLTIDYNYNRINTVLFWLSQQQNFNLNKEELDLLININLPASLDYVIRTLMPEGFNYKKNIIDFEAAIAKLKYSLSKSRELFEKNTIANFEKFLDNINYEFKNLMINLHENFNEEKDRMQQQIDILHEKNVLTNAEKVQIKLLKQQLEELTTKTYNEFTKIPQVIATNIIDKVAEITDVVTVLDTVDITEKIETLAKSIDTIIEASNLSDIISRPAPLLVCYDNTSNSNNSIVYKLLHEPENLLKKEQAAKVINLSSRNDLIATDLLYYAKNNSKPIIKVTECQCRKELQRKNPDNIRTKLEELVIIKFNENILNDKNSNITLTIFGVFESNGGNNNIGLELYILVAKLIDNNFNNVTLNIIDPAASLMPRAKTKFINHLQELFGQVEISERFNINIYRDVDSYLNQTKSNKTGFAIACFEDLGNEERHDYYLKNNRLLEKHDMIIGTKKYRNGSFKIETITSENAKLVAPKAEFFI